MNFIDVYLIKLVKIKDIYINLIIIYGGKIIEIKSVECCIKKVI